MLNSKTQPSLRILFGASLCLASIVSTAAENSTDVPDQLAGIESIRVSFDRHRQGETLISEFVTVAESTTPGYLADLLALEPGVSLNGQPGLFQTVNVRGLARQRVLTFLNGMRLTSERRAGVAASFIDPLLLSGVEIIQGPSSTYYGSGALGGALQLITRDDRQPWLSAGYFSDGSERSLAGGSGGDNYSLGLALRSRDQGETVLGDVKNDGFDQYSGFLTRRFDLGNYELDWQVIASEARDIDKDNSRFPDDRIVGYPQESHLLSQLMLSGSGDWRARLSLHQQSLTTTELRPGIAFSEVDNESLDIGFALEDRWQAGDFSGQYGIDYFGRRGVDVQQVDSDFSTSALTTSRPLANGEEDETAIFATLNRDLNVLSLHAGGRYTYFSQSNRGSQFSTARGSYFMALSKPLGAWDLGLSYGTGTRFASLSERFFTGTTGRGQTIGNAALTAEQSSELNLSLNYSAENLSLEMHLFENQIEDFIDRVELDADTLSYRNLLSGDIQGWQYRLTLLPLEDWQLEFSGQGIKGESETGAALFDIPARRHQLEMRYSGDNWSAGVSMRRRLAQTRFGAGEQPLAAASIGALRLDFELSPRWQLQAAIENLFDEQYFNSADELSTLAIGREFMLSVTYQ